MQETPQQYTQRMLKHSQGKNPLRLQKGTHKKLAALTKRLNKKKLTRRPAPDKLVNRRNPRSFARRGTGDRLSHTADPGFQRHRHSGLQSGTHWPKSLQLWPPRSQNLPGDVPFSPGEQFAALEFSAASILGELWPAPGARKRKCGASHEDDGWPRSDHLLQIEKIVKNAN